MTHRRTWPFLMMLAAAATGGGIAVQACSETGPDAEPRQNGCIGASCFDGAAPVGDGGPGSGDGGADGPVVYGDPLAGTSKTATLVKGGFTFTEGPVWVSGRLLFSDVPTNTIHQLLDDGGTAPFRQNSNGANGNAVDPQGRLVTCEGSRGRLTRTNTQLGDPQPVIETLAGKRFNAPNDLVVRQDGTIYFTDPLYGPVPDGGLPQGDESVYQVAPDGGATRLAFDFTKPNGIALSPGGDTLYVVDNGDGRVLAADLEADGSLKGPFAKIAEADGADGMAVDLAGNLYVTSVAGVQVFDRTGKALGTITIPMGAPSNCAFGGPGMKTLYITSNLEKNPGGTGLYAITLNVPGLP